jgi:hypothetical protein
MVVTNAVCSFILRFPAQEKMFCLPRNSYMVFLFSFQTLGRLVAFLDSILSFSFPNRQYTAPKNFEYSTLT